MTSPELVRSLSARKMGLPPLANVISVTFGAQLVMAIILHITTSKAWNKAAAEGIYRTDTLPMEGFIHCSTRDQVIQVANIRFRGQAGLILLFIDTDKVTRDIIYENLEGGQQMFPHIYGELNIDAVVQVAEFEPAADGDFDLPHSDIQ